MSRPVTILKKFPTLCDWCAKERPTLVYDMPPGTPLWHDRMLNMTTYSTGWVASCEACRALVGTALVSLPGAATALAARFVEVNREAFAAGVNTPGDVHEFRERLNRLLLKRITNLGTPRVYVPFEDPLEGKFVEVNPHA